MKTPEGLGAAGRELWKALTEDVEYEDASEVETLRVVCRMADRIETLREALDGASLIVTGSQGQDRAHPLLAELRLVEAEYVRVLVRLRPEPDDADSYLGSSAKRSANARAASRARWHGKAAS